MVYVVEQHSYHILYQYVSLSCYIKVCVSRRIRLNSTNLSDTSHINSDVRIETTFNP